MPIWMGLQVGEACAMYRLRASPKPTSISACPSHTPLPWTAGKLTSKCWRPRENCRRSLGSCSTDLAATLTPFLFAAITLRSTTGELIEPFSTSFQILFWKCLNLLGHSASSRVGRLGICTIVMTSQWSILRDHPRSWLSSNKPARGGSSTSRLRIDTTDDSAIGKPERRVPIRPISAAPSIL